MNQIPSEIVEDGINAADAGVAGSYRYPFKKAPRLQSHQSSVEDQKRFRAKGDRDRLRVLTATRIARSIRRSRTAALRNS
jgi:hypothetical protein